MITAVEIENFKAFGERQRIELAPITLLFGPNSGGKSSIIHALHYAREIFERHNLDADKTIAGGDHVDLGGFENFIHRAQDGDYRDCPYGRSIRLRFELDVRDVQIPEVDPLLGSGLALAYDDRTNPFVEGADWIRKTETVALDIVIERSSQHSQVFVSEIRAEINGHPLCRIVCSLDSRSVAITEINKRHPSCNWHLSEEEDFWLDSLWHDLPDQLPQPTEPLESGLWPALLPLSGQADALPNLNDGLIPHNVDMKSVDGLADPDYGVAAVFVLNQWIVGPLRLLRHWLSGLRYVGPIRALPSRTYQAPRFPDDARWASGLAAWDVLTSAPSPLIDRVNAWLGAERLDTKMSILCKEFREITPDMLDALIKLDAETIESMSDRFDNDACNLWANANDIPVQRRIFLADERSGIHCQVQDVGVGLAQLVPVVVGALDHGTTMLIVEQPELHLHPRIQAEMGDLFLSEALSDGRTKQFILETHSEHLVLRLLRRIRETGEQTVPNDLRCGPDDVGVYYIDPCKDGSTIRRLRIDKEGEFIDRWPHGFFDERAEELFS